MTKKIKTLLAAATLAAMMSSSAAYAEPFVATATASVVTALEVTNPHPLTFGNFVSSSTAGTISTDGSVSGGVTYINGARKGTFEVRGTPDSTVNISGNTPITLTKSGGGSMSAALVYPTSKPLNGDGVGGFDITGTLTVAADQPLGEYSGTYNVTVDYQ